MMQYNILLGITKSWSVFCLQLLGNHGNNLQIKKYIDIPIITQKNLCVKFSTYKNDEKHKPFDIQDQSSIIQTYFCICPKRMMSYGSDLSTDGDIDIQNNIVHIS